MITDNDATLMIGAGWALNISAWIIWASTGLSAIAWPMFLAAFILFLLSFLLPSK